MGSEREGCRLIGVSRSTVRYESHGSDDVELRTRLKVLAEKYLRCGYPTLHDLLKVEGLVRNPKRTYRIYSEEGIQVRRKKRKKLTRPRIPMSLPARQNERWSIDFVSDQLATGRRFQALAWCASWIRWYGCRKRLSATMARNSRARLCFSGLKNTASSCNSFSQASRHRIPMLNLSMASSESTAWICIGSKIWRMRAMRLTHGANTTTEIEVVALGIAHEQSLALERTGDSAADGV